ncbi:MAG: hypothetical protein ACYC7L_06025 [Nitrospirota bacterium]
MTLSKLQQIKLLAAMVAVIIALNVYQRYTEEQPQSRPLAYTRGMKAAAPVRKSASPSGAQQDPLAVMLEGQAEKYPGVARDLFRMTGSGGPAKPKPSVPKPVAVVSAPASTIPVRTPEELAADAARADLSRFRFLGYLTDRDSSLFLSKDGELFIVKSGDTVLKGYRVKAVGKDHVILQDTATKVEVKVELTGSGGK